jgi:predicted ATP-grasp superfamily ATP-dependent carboligase
LGRHITALGTIRSLAQNDIKTYYVTETEPYMVASRFYKKPPQNYPLIADSSQLADYLEDFPIRECVLFPCSDEWVIASAQLNHEILKRFPVSQSKRAVINCLIDKNNLAKILDQNKIPHPWSIHVESEIDLVPVANRPEIDWFLKPTDSQSFRTHYQVKAFRVNSWKEAFSRYQDAKNAGLGVMLQEYIPGPASNHYFIDGFIDKNRQIRSLFVRQRIRMHPPDFGDSSYMRSILPGKASPAIDSILKLLNSVAYRGIFSAEFKMDDRDGCFKLIEVNTRAWAYIGFAANCGVNIAHQAYRDALGLEVPTVRNYATGKSMVFIPNDFAACLRMIREKKLSIFGWIKSWLFVSRAIFEWSDPMPGVICYLERLRAKYRKTIPGREDKKTVKSSHRLSKVGK